MTDQERAVMQQALEALERGMFHRELIPLREKAITALRAALAQQQPEPVQEPLVWEPVVRDRPWPYLTALTQREYDALHADLRWNYKKIPPPKAEPVQEPVAWIQPDHLQKARVAPFFCRVEPTPRCADFVPLYTTPPQRPPLTDEEIDKATAQERDALLDHIYEYGTAAEGVLERIRKLCRAVERRVREKRND